MNLTLKEMNYSTDIGASNIRPLHPRLTDRIAVSLQEGLFIIKCADILYCEASSNYCKVYQSNGKCMLVSKTLKRITSHLPSMGFIRIHQSYIVNFEAISQVGISEVILVNGKQLPISNSRRKSLLQTLQAKLNIV